MKSGFVIRSAACAFPDRIVSNEELCERLESTPAWIENRTGIKARHVCGTQTLEETALKAARLALEQAGKTAEDLDVIVCATSSPDFILPSLACRIAAGLHHPSGALSAFDVQAACCGFLYALQTGAALLEEGRCALIVGAEKLSALTDWTDRESCILFGDGAGAVVIEKQKDSPVYFWNGWKPDEKDVLSIAGPAACQSGFAQEKNGCPKENSRKESRISMKGRDVFRFAVEAMPEAVRQVIQAAGRKMEQIDWLVPHQANLRIIEHSRTKLGIAPEKVIVCLADTANTSAASIPIALAKACQENRFRTGDEIVLCAFGAGLSYGGAYLKWHNS